MLARVIRCGSESEATPGPAYSKIFPAPPRTLSRRRSSMITSFAVTHGWSSPVSHTLTTSGIVKEYGPPPSATATSRPPAPIASMPAAPQSGGVAVGAEQRLPGHREALEVHLVADAVAGLGEDRAVAARGGLEVAVVVGVARVHLVDVGGDVGDEARRHDVREARGLELEPRHR